MTRYVAQSKKYVLPSLYNEEYFYDKCGGYEEYRKSKGLSLPPFLKEALRMANLASCDVILDIGCGRGEIVMHSSSYGIFSVGIDYSVTAIRIVKETAVAFSTNARSRTSFILADAGYLPFKDEIFSVIFLMDVVEHLYPYQLESALEDIYQVLKPNGRLVIHTSPNALIIKYGVPLLRILAFLKSEKVLGISCKIKDPRKVQDRVLHVNEQSPIGLKRKLREIGFGQIKIIVKGVERETQFEKYLKNFLPFLSGNLIKMLLKSPLGLFAENGFWTIASKRHNKSKIP